jgi:NAD(P)-dependent dehydrogenase (short-subunit alcohol dehydrogenase family)
MDEGTNVLVTGATDGLGLEVARRLAGTGATVLMHGRDPQRGARAVEQVRAATGNERLRYYNADFARLGEVRRMADEIGGDVTALHLLVNNAGMGAGKRTDTRELNEDGYELRFTVNYLAGFLLTELLLPLVEAGAPARIVNVASVGQAAIDFDDVMLARRYEPLRAYSQAKLAQIMHTFDLGQRLPADRVTVNALHPASLMNTKMVEETFGYTMSTVEDGADATMRLAVAPELVGVTGAYFDQTRPARADGQAYDEKARARLRELSEQLVGLG